MMRADLASVGTRFFPVHILGAEFDVLYIAQPLRNARQGRERRNDHDINPRLFANFHQKRIEKRVGLADGHIHLPIGCEDLFAHGNQGLSASAATPGSVLPSSSSSEAPPPVEMKVTLSATPARLTALTLSPPPIMLLQPEFAAMASAMAKVPFAHSLISNTPISPFQTTVFAPATSAANSFTVSGPISTPSQPSEISSPGCVYLPGETLFASKSRCSTI